MIRVRAFPALMKKGIIRMPESAFQTSVSLVRALIWPLLIVLVAYQFSEPIRNLLDRVNSAAVKVPGGEAELTFAAIVQSGKQDIAQQVTLVTALPISHTEEAAKGAPEDIPGMIQRQVQALGFTLGSGTYNGGPSWTTLTLLSHTVSLDM
jgi:hypothetical protein